MSNPNAIGVGTLSNRFPVYQVDFNVVSAGKHIASSKRRICWRFGFPNKDALDGGETGTACRGKEHEVSLVWSVTSGKKLILTDGREIYHSVSRSGSIEHTWTMEGNHSLRIIAHSTPPITSTPSYYSSSSKRQYDLYIDGLSFFSMPKVYELGLKGSVSAQDRIPGLISDAERFDRPNPSNGRYDYERGEYIMDAPLTPKQEEEDLQKAIAESLEESRAHLREEKETKDAKPASPPSESKAEPAPASEAPAPPVQEENLLLDFFSDPIPTSAPESAPGQDLLVPSASQPVNQWNQQLSVPTQPSPVVDPWAAPAPPAASSIPYKPSSAPAPTSDLFAPQSPSIVSGADPFAAQTPFVPTPAADPFGAQSTLVSPALANDPFAPHSPSRPPYTDISSPVLQTYPTQMQTPERNLGNVSGPKDDTATITGGMSMMNPFDNSPRYGNNTLQPALGQMKAGNLPDQETKPVMNQSIMGSQNGNYNAYGQQNIGLNQNGNYGYGMTASPGGYGGQQMQQQAADGAYGSQALQFQQQAPPSHPQTTYGNYQY